MFENFELKIKLEDGGIMPTRAHDTDAGCDVYSPIDVIIPPRKDVLIPLNWRCQFPEGHAMIMKEKSGVATKKKLDIGACIHKDTLIKTSKGLFPAHQLTLEFINDNNILIESYNRNTSKVEYKECDGFRISNYTECIKLTFDNRQEIIVSNDHMLLTANGWIMAKNLIEEDEILSI